jgi:uncharacterized membrane protein
MIEGRVHTPPGWRHDPPGWTDRRLLLALALFAAGVAAYLSLFQLGYVKAVWDPIFGLGSASVLDSSISRAFPVPDAALGCVAYVIDAVLIFAGDKRRWQTSPWLVIANAIVSGLLGLTAITLIALQAFVIHAWCSLCLVSAAISLLLAYSAGRELVATIQFLKRESHRGHHLWPLITGEPQ